GGGTGNFISHLLDNGNPVPLQITVADLVPEALSQAANKLGHTINGSKKNGRFGSICCDIEMNRYLPVGRFIKGQFSSFKELVDKIENLTVQTAARIEEFYSPRLHRILRGEPITSQMKEWINRTFELPEIRTILDFNMAARYVRGLEKKLPTYKQLVFSGDLTTNLHLPFKSDQYNKILLSLVLSYIFNPLETLLELRRILSPEGLLVISSVRPDADASGLFTKLVEKVDHMPEESFPEGWDKQLVLASVRSFLNDAQALVELEEAGTFDFFDPEKLTELLEEAGFQYLQTIETFGDPAQGYVCVAKK
ncbi:methyltransferase domain-containing protein, partial [Acidobacteriota bacterium]